MLGRLRKRLGNAVGLTQFGVNLTTPEARRLVVAAPLARGRGRADLPARRRSWCWSRTTARPCSSRAMRPAGRRMRANGHCLINRSDRTTPCFSRSAPAPPSDRVDYPDIDMRLERDAAGRALSAQVRGALSMTDKNFTVRRRRRRHRARHLGHAGPLDERHRHGGDRGAVGDRRAGHRRRRHQGRGHHLGQGHVLRRRRPHHAGSAQPDLRRHGARSRARRPRPRSCSRRAASCRCSTGGWRPAASRGSRRSTAPRSAARSSSASPATIASPPRTRRRASACRRSRSACSRAPAAPSGSPA